MIHRSILLILCTFVTSVVAEPVKVGAIFPLTGTVAPWGEQLRVGLSTANEVQENQFSITYEDEGPCVGQNAVTAYRKLMSHRDIKVIFLGCLSGAEAIAPIAAKDNILLLSLGLLNESSLNSGANLVDLATEIGIEGDSLAKFVARENSQRIAGLFFADSFGAEFSKVVSKNLTANGTTLLAQDDADAQAQSFQPLILRWKNLGVDLLITSLSDRQQLTLYKEMEQLKFRPKVFSTYSLEAYAPPEKERKYFEGIKYTHPVNDFENSSETVAFLKKLSEHQSSGVKSNINALFAYDGIKFLKNAISKCGDTNPKCLYKFFLDLGHQHGVSGEMRFEKSGALTRPYGLKIVRSGEFQWLERTVLNQGR
jgi:ABC-type branched-subunit amino acid transport system substrate-binding protein